MPKTESMRLDRFLSNQMNISRADAKELIKKRVVTVNGETAKLFDMKVNPESDEVTADGKAVVYRKHVYIMLNKPSGVVCATRDKLSETVLELIPPELRRSGLFPAGRLDQKSTLTKNILPCSKSLQRKAISSCLLRA